MGYYKDTGSLQSMASAEAILKKRMPEKVGILPVAELLFVAEKELREALNPSTTIDEKISFLEEIAAQNGGQL